MAYILPRVQIEQEFSQTAVFSEQPLAALIIGPNYNLFRYDVSAEKASTLALDEDESSAYDSVSGGIYAYPSLPVGGVVDASYTKVFFDDVQATYFPLESLTANPSVSDVITVNGTYKNRVSSAVAVFKETSYSVRSVFFGNRDVAVGDVATVHGTGGGGVTVVAKVTGVLQAVIPAANGSVTPNGGNSGDAAVPTITSTGSAWRGTANTIYRVKVVTAGGHYSDDPAAAARIQITSSGTDSSPVTNMDFETDIDIGNFGLTIQFSGLISDLYVVGDEWLISMTAATAGNANILTFDQDVDTCTGTVTLKLAVNKADVEIPEIRSANDVTVNWSADDSSVTVEDGITITDALLVDPSGDVVALPVVAGTVYISYRALNSTLASSISSIANIAEVEDALGVIHPDNALAEGVYDALLNAANVAVYYVAVATDDLSGYVAALDLARQTDAVYGLVPLTFDSAVADAVVAHVDLMSTAAEAKWRKAWLSSPLVTTAVIVDTKENGDDFVATVADNPTVSGTQYTLVSVPAATLITDGVRIGDTLRINFTTASDGTVVYESYTISEIRTESSVVVSSAIGLIVSPIKVQIARTYTKDEQIDNLALVGSGYDNRRVNMVFPDTAKTGSVVKNGYFVAAALAGLRSGSVPHQGLTNIEVLGFDDLSKAVTGFTQTQLNRLAESGYWIVTQTRVGASAYTRHQLTTDSSGLNFVEDNITTNVDSISYGLQRVLAPYIGIYNVNPTNVLLIRSVIDAELRFRLTGTFNVRAGNQLNGYTINSLAADLVFKDRIAANITLDVPAPMNSINITLVI